MSFSSRQRLPFRLGPIALWADFASGGMAKVIFGTRMLPDGRCEHLAVKRLHEQFLGDSTFVEMFLDEGRLAKFVQHPNVVPTLEVIDGVGEPFLVMPYVHSEPLSKLLTQCRQGGRRPSVGIAVTIIVDVLKGLQAIHEAVDEHGKRLDLVHRDVTPSNILIDQDGVAHTLDFGIAKGHGRAQQTGSGQLKGKFGYMAPEQVRAVPVDGRTDIFGASLVLWELIVGTPLFQGETYAAMLTQLLSFEPKPPSNFNPHVPPALDAILLKGISKAMDDRFPSAKAMVEALKATGLGAGHAAVAAWLEPLAGERLRSRAEHFRKIEEQAPARTESLPNLATGSGGYLSIPSMASGAPPAHGGGFLGPPSETSTAMVLSAGMAALGGARRSGEVPVLATPAVPVYPSSPPSRPLDVDLALQSVASASPVLSQRMRSLVERLRSIPRPALAGTAVLAGILLLFVLPRGLSKPSQAPSKSGASADNSVQTTSTDLPAATPADWVRGLRAGTPKVRLPTIGLDLSPVEQPLVRCFESALGRDRTQGGTVTVLVKTDRQGNPATVELNGGRLDEEAHRCAISAIRGLRPARANAGRDHLFSIEFYRE